MENDDALLEQLKALPEEDIDPWRQNEIRRHAHRELRRPTAPDVPSRWPLAVAAAVVLAQLYWAWTVVRSLQG